ncbi:curli-like amyloid fiber formation chaperone CsgH [Afifella pfennigii]|uniref:curli-like amyloid fiber formation chaperone CsgH n=1 Tax=Afifella pfennigii TaxID=209897 RepID=UPI0005563E4D|nr:curli-like amyloid fiber formation chaperone CsgH [Afifella pfennigii]
MGDAVRRPPVSFALPAGLISAFLLTTDMASGQSEALSCSVTAERQDSLVRISGKVEGPGNTAGRYRLLTTVKGSSGQSLSSQSGAFAIDEEGVATVGNFVFSVSPDSRFEAELRVEAGAESTTCRIVSDPDAGDPEAGPDEGIRL